MFGNNKDRVEELERKVTLLSNEVEKLKKEIKDTFNNKDFNNELKSAIVKHICEMFGFDFRISDYFGKAYIKIPSVVTENPEIDLQGVLSPILLDILTGPTQEIASNYVGTEDFLDSIVDRIKRKQVWFWKIEI